MFKGARDASPAYPFLKNIYYRELAEPHLTSLDPPAAPTGTLHNLVLLPQILSSPLVNSFHPSLGEEEPPVASCLSQFWSLMLITGYGRIQTPSTGSKLKNQSEVQAQTFLDVYTPSNTALLQISKSTLKSARSKASVLKDWTKAQMSVWLNLLWMTHLSDIFKIVGRLQAGSFEAEESAEGRGG